MQTIVQLWGKVLTHELSSSLLIARCSNTFSILAEGNWFVWVLKDHGIGEDMLADAESTRKYCKRAKKSLRKERCRTSSA